MEHAVCIPVYIQLTHLGPNQPKETLRITLNMLLEGSNLFIFYHISCMDMYKYQISSVREHNNFQQIFPLFQEPDPIDGMHPLDCMDVDNMHAFTLGTGQTESGQANTISIRPRSSSEIKSRSRSRCILVSKALIFFP